MVFPAPFASPSLETARPTFVETPVEIRDPTARRCFEEARRLYQEGKDKKAQERLNQAVTIVIEIDPALAASLWNSAGVALGMLGGATKEQGWYKEALKCFEKALEINSKYAFAWHNKGVALDKTGRPEEALECYEKALGINPKLAQAWCNKGVALGRMGKPEEALECFEKALGIDPKYVLAWYNKGLALGKQGDATRGQGWYKEALKCFEKALEINSKYALAWHNKGLALYKMGRPPQEELECYDNALEIDPGLAEAWRNKAEALQGLGRQEEAQKSLERAEFYEAIKYYEENKERLLEKYEGKFVAILHNKVIDSDEDFEALGERIIEKFGSRDLLVRRVTREPEIISIPTPFLVQ